MLVTLPKDNEEFLSISGVGLSKLDKYGKQFLDVIAQFNAR